MAYYTPATYRNPLGGYSRLGTGGGITGIPVPTDYWKLNNAAATSEVDSIAGGFTIDKGGGTYPTYATTSPFAAERVWVAGNFLFDQTGGQANLKPGSGAWTLTCWIKPTDNVGFKAPIEFSNFASRGITLQQNVAVLTVQTYDTGGAHNSGKAWSGSLTAGAWHFVCARYDGGTPGSAILDIRVNAGAFESLTTAFPQSDITTDTFYVGGNANKFLGGIARVGWWKGTRLSDANVSALYASGAGADPPLA